MARPDFPFTVLEFQRRFATEPACWQYLVESRWPDGYICSRCGSHEAFVLPKRHLFQCKRCGYQSSVTAGTVMHRTRLPLRLWFYAAWLVTTQTPGMSAVQFQRQIGLRNYAVAFQMLHKLRAAMVKEARERLHGVVEADETYVGGPKTGPGGRGALGKVIVAGAVEVRDEYAGRIRLRVVSDASGKSLVGFIKTAVDPRTIVRTDDWAGYASLGKAGYAHKVIYARPGQTQLVLPHIHHAFGNLKAWLIGTHHGVSPQHLQAYLNEFVFRYNRRNTPQAAFQTVLGLIAERRGPTYRDIYGIAKGETGYVHPNPKEFFNE